MTEVTRHNNITASSWMRLAANYVINPNYYFITVFTTAEKVAIVVDREDYHINYESLLFYVSQVICSTTENIPLLSMLQDVRAQRHF